MRNKVDSIVFIFNDEDFNYNRKLIKSIQKNDLMGTVDYILGQRICISESAIADTLQEVRDNGYQAAVWDRRRGRFIN